jgi:hypothetical protein
MTAGGTRVLPGRAAPVALFLSTGHPGSGRRCKPEISVRNLKSWTGRKGRDAEQHHVSATWANFSQHLHVRSELPAFDEALKGMREGDELRAAVGYLPERMGAVIRRHYGEDTAFPRDRLFDARRPRASQIHCETVRRLRGDTRLTPEKSLGMAPSVAQRSGRLRKVPSYETWL